MGHKGGKHLLDGEAIYHALFILMLGSFVVTAIQPGEGIGPVLLQIVGGLMMMGAVVAVWQEGGLRWFGLAIAIPALLMLAADPEHDLLATSILRSGAGLFLAIVILTRIYRHELVTAATISGSLSVYLLLGMIWAGVYEVIEQLAPGSFRGIDTSSLTASVSDLGYYSFVTLTTLGYGDITPVSPAAKSMAVLEAIIGQLYLVVAVARMVALMGPPRR